MRVLKVSDLKRKVTKKEIKFNTTEEVEPLQSIIEQDIPVKAIELGLTIKTKNYNIYISGNPGTGRATALRKIFEKITPNEETPEDICYVNNFENPYQPIFLKFPAGKAKEFKKSLNDTINDLKVSLPRKYNSREYQSKLEKIISDGIEAENNSYIELTEKARSYDFVIKSTKDGIVTIPIFNNRILSNKEYDELPPEVKKEIEAKRKKLTPHIQEFIFKTKEIELNTHKKIMELQKQLIIDVVEPEISRLKKKFGYNEKIIKYLDSIFNDILENPEKFLPKDFNPELAARLAPIDFEEYDVNIMVTHKGRKGSPVIFEHNPSYTNLIGKIERVVEQGNYVTDFTLIRPGSILQANGGYLVINTIDLLIKPFAWQALKNVLRTRELAIEDLSEQLGFFTASGLKPEPIPVNFKVILIGNEYLYHLLYNYDEDFRKHFQIKAEFDDEAKFDKKNIELLSKFVATIVKKEKLLHLEGDGFAEIIEYILRKAESKNKMLIKFSDIANLLVESNYFAKKDNSDLIKRKHVKRAIEERKRRSFLIPDKIYSYIEEDTIMIDISGSKVGQVNGLAVFQLGDISFGKPVKITAQAFPGKEGIISIDREAKLSGKIFNKASFIISAYLKKMLQRKKPLSLNISLSFEQSYGGIDGDSASLAEIFAILSSVGKVPLKQNIAVTGSVNQHGEVQPIGGVNEKIEGFFEVCKRKKFKEPVGVIIPYQNIKNLMLSDEVLDAYKKGKLKIWAVQSVKEGMEIISGIPFGEPDENGNFPEGSVLDLCKKEISKFEGKKEEKNDKKDKEAIEKK